MSQSREEWLAEMTDTLGVDREDVLEVAAMFFDAIEARLAAIFEAQKTGNLAELTRLIHGLKGDAANIGFKSTSAVARTLETQCREGTVSDFAGQFAALQAAVQAQRQAIEPFSDAAEDSGESSSGKPA